jgi:hypothetical protein
MDDEASIMSPAIGGVARHGRALLSLEAHDLELGLSGPGLAVAWVVI